MTKPTVAESIKFLTTTEAARELGISRPMLRRRINQEVFSPPIHINEHNLWFFDDDWLKRAKLVLACEHGKITHNELRTALEMMDETQEEAGKETQEAHKRVVAQALCGRRTKTERN